MRDFCVRTERAREITPPWLLPLVQSQRLRAAWYTRIPGTAATEFPLIARSRRPGGCVRPADGNGALGE
jgi:hypothetical protein